MSLVQNEGNIYEYDYGNNVCNGIAYDPAEDAFYVTGKRWNMMFKIRLDPNKR
jgi:glutaminyl-peptide cyclotransferase